ncbi:MAG: ferredoxin [Syntrophales bacterium]
MRVRVDEEICVGCEACAEACPEIFEMNGEFAVPVIEDDVPEELEEICRETADTCPVESIIIMED